MVVNKFMTRYAGVELEPHKVMILEYVLFKRFTETNDLNRLNHYTL